MHIGITLPASGPLATPASLATIATRAEELGFSSIWVGDHVVIPVESVSRYPYSPDGRMNWGPDTPWLDPFLALTWAAAHTRTILLGTSVLVLPMRPTLLVAKLTATLDHLSGGRVILGVGSGWLAEEFTLLGQSFEDRSARMVEAINVLRACWSEGLTEFHGRFHDLALFGFAPKPAQGPRLPIVLGGHSEVALRRVAAVGDGWNPTRLSPDQFAQTLSRLRTLMDERGRSMHDLLLIARPGLGEPNGPDVAEHYAELGVQHMIVEVSYRNLTLEQATVGINALGEQLIH